MSRVNFVNFSLIIDEEELTTVLIDTENLDWDDTYYWRVRPLYNDGIKKSYTKISFIPDFSRFGTDGLSDDMISLFERKILFSIFTFFQIIHCRYSGWGQCKETRNKFGPKF